MKNIKVTISYVNEDKITKCKCGNPMSVVEGNMLCSIPPMYNIFCEKCGATDYIDCNKYSGNGIVRENISLKDFKKLLEECD